MKDMTIKHFNGRVKEFLGEVTQAEWVMDGIDEVCAKAEAFDNSKAELQKMIDIYTDQWIKAGPAVRDGLDEMIAGLKDAKSVLEHFEGNGRSE